MVELAAFTPFDQPTAIAVGVFDGVHLGHRAVIARAAAAKAEGLTPCVFTFAAASIPCKQGRTLSHLYTDAQKRALLEECGVQSICSPPFSEVCACTGEEFAWDILCRRLHARKIICGGDFRFGKGAAWGVEELSRFGEAMGFSVEAVPSVTMGGEVVSSRRIRAALADGALSTANALLGAPYTILRCVEHGNEIGRTLGFPTINQYFETGQCLPRYGVYASEVCLDGRRYAGMTNVGVRPTIAAGERPLAETHILDWSGSLYGQNITVALTRYLRTEHQFDSLGALRAQLDSDIRAVRAGADTSPILPEESGRQEQRR